MHRSNYSTVLRLLGARRPMLGVAAGEQLKRIARDYPVTIANIGAITRRETWKHV